MEKEGEIWRKRGNYMEKEWERDGEGNYMEKEGERDGSTWGEKRQQRERLRSGERDGERGGDIEKEEE